MESRIERIASKNTKEKPRQFAGAFLLDIVLYTYLISVSTVKVAKYSSGIDSFLSVPGRTRIGPIGFLLCNLRSFCCPRYLPGQFFKFGIAQFDVGGFYILLEVFY